MHIDLKSLVGSGERIAVAVSGGIDSMSLLYYMHQNARLYDINVIALNVEHGIRGESSISDSNFVKDYCHDHGIPLISYEVDSLKKAKDDKLSIEQSARELRYQCFNDAITSNKCDKVATAHHRDDNVESVLFNLFRGTGLKGLSGIQKCRDDQIIRPFLSVDRKTIVQYALDNNIPFVVDQTNLSTDYTRNAIRHNVIPKINELFPELNRSIERLSQTVTLDDEYLTEQANALLTFTNGAVKLAIPCHPALIGRAVISALKHLGVSKDWEKKHIDDVIALSDMQNGNMLTLLGGITAVKEYSKIVFFKQADKDLTEIPFSIGTHQLADKTFTVTSEKTPVNDLKNGFYADLDKVPKTAVFRIRRPSDTFEKLGGGSKSLGDYLTDKKVPLRKRDSLILLADGKEVLLILGIAVSDKIKVESSTKNLISFTLKTPN